MIETPPRFEAEADFSEDPRLLLRKFLWIGLLCVAAVLALATYGVYRVYSWRLVESAHSEAQAVCQVVLIKEKKHLLRSDETGKARLELPDSDRILFNRRLRQYLEPFAVDAVWIWDTHYRIVNRSGDERGVPIGYKSPGVAQALAGKRFSRLESVRDPNATGKTIGGSSEQMVSYLPIWGRDKEILGAIEIRRNIAAFRQDIRRGVLSSSLLLGTVLLTLFGCVFLLVKKGADRLARAQDALRRLATTDPLTGVCNRREVLVRADESFSRQMEGHDPDAPARFGILMLDFDNFKTINDTYGHLAGDGVLQELARRIRVVLRPQDILGRVGGEEFLVVLPGSSPEQCEQIAERLCQVVRAEPFQVGSFRLFGSISIGGAFARPFDKNVRGVLQRADEGLYRAKNLGKDRTSWAGESLSGADLFHRNGV